MKKIISLFSLLLSLISCQNIEPLSFIADLPKNLNEVSGTEIITNSNLIWMINDSGNSSKLYGLSNKGKVKKEIKIKAKNHDWEDLASDKKGNIYIGDFGNNLSKRKNLTILKVYHKDLKKKKVNVDRIEFYYPNQQNFPPKKNQLFFDSEAFFIFKNNIYIFTKSRVKNMFGKTSLYRIPAKKGNHKAEFISEFNNCNDLECWITAADISDDGSKVVLLTQESVLVFDDFKNDDFLSGKVKKIFFKDRSQKEGICFKDNNTLLITDEKAHGLGGNLYQLKID